jgi:hypothetical protein
MVFHAMASHALVANRISRQGDAPVVSLTLNASLSASSMLSARRQVLVSTSIIYPSLLRVSELQQKLVHRSPAESWLTNVSSQLQIVHQARFYATSMRCWQLERSTAYALRVSPLHCAIFFLISTYLCDSTYSTSASRSVQLIYAP